MDKFWIPGMEQESSAEDGRVVCNAALPQATKLVTFEPIERHCVTRKSERPVGTNSTSLNTLEFPPVFWTQPKCHDMGPTIWLAPNLNAYGREVVPVRGLIGIASVNGTHNRCDRSYDAYCNPDTPYNYASNDPKCDILHGMSSSLGEAGRLFSAAAAPFGTNSTTRSQC